MARTEAEVATIDDEAAAPAAVPPSSAPRAVTPPSMRRRVQEASDRAAAATTRDQLPGYLDELIARARSKGEVTALELEVGRDLIKQLGGGLQTEMKFVARVNELARELRREDGGAAPTEGEALHRLDSIAEQMEAETDAAKRGELSRAYLEQAARLPPEQRTRMMTRLNQLIAGPPASPPSASELDARFAAIHSAAGADRSAAIETFLEAVRQLPPDQKLAQMRRLDSVLPRGGSGTAP